MDYAKVFTNWNLLNAAFACGRLFPRTYRKQLSLYIRCVTSGESCLQLIENVGSWDEHNLIILT